jgi:hydrogenase maturation protein HypF
MPRQLIPNMPVVTPTNSAVVRIRILVGGAVQGVGFRPFVHRRATALGLAGWVSNSAAGVTIEAEGDAHRVQALLAELRTSPPANAAIAAIETCEICPSGDKGFAIRASDTEGALVAHVLPDLATCDECLREMFDPADRRYRYAFINCTQCGPRHSIIEAIPYDRARTSMRHFRMCPACQAEYDDPMDRRFHAEPNACAVCGPRLLLWDGTGQVLASGHDAISAAADAVRAGHIIAAKGIGGFHLIADARDNVVVQRLRDRKRREDKPFAVMFANLTGVQECCRVSPEEAALLSSPVRPVGLLWRVGGDVCEAVAPGNPSLGVMLPYAPLHHLLLQELAFPVVATSGNVSDEPIATDERDVLARLGGIADLFLVHNRPIVRAVDDSVVRIVCGREFVVRRGRGLAPMQLSVPGVAGGILAVGGHLKTTVALSRNDNVVLSQHIGDLTTPAARAAHACAMSDLARLHAVEPRLAVCDLHPDYASCRAAAAADLPVVVVQHHLAHVIACMAEQGLRPPVLGVAWDGTGLGADGAIWGGEFLLVRPGGACRAAHLRPFRLPGGEAAANEPRRAALGVLFEAFGDGVFTREDLAPVAAFTPAERRVLARMLRSATNAPWSTSVGRLFDAFASILGLRQRASYEGQAAAELEWAAAGVAAEQRYEFRVMAPEEREKSQLSLGGVRVGGEARPAAEPRRVLPDLRPPPATAGGVSVYALASLVVDWQPALRSALTDLQSGKPTGAISAAFHAGLAAVIAEIARRIGERCVVLSGGCFQNVRLVEAAVAALRAAGHQPVWHERLPPNDGGLALGQAVWAAWSEGQGDESCASRFRAGLSASSVTHR